MRLKTKRIFKVAKNKKERKETNNTQGSIHLTADFSAETSQDTKELDDIFNVQGKKCQPGKLYSSQMKR